MAVNHAKIDRLLADYLCLELKGNNGGWLYANTLKALGLSGVNDSQLEDVLKARIKWIEESADQHRSKQKDDY